MLQPEQIEELISLVSALERGALVRQFLNFQSAFPIDFTREFLDSLPLERLRHIFVALCIQCQRVPTFSDIAVA